MEEVDLERRGVWEGGAIFVRRVEGGMAFGRHFGVGAEEWYVWEARESLT